MSDISAQLSTEPTQIGKRTAQGGGLLVMARLLTRLIDLATMLTLTRVLVPSDFGLVAIAMTLVSVAEAALDLPINEALLRLSHITRAHYDAAFTIGLLRGGVLFLIFIIVAQPFAAIYNDSRLVWLVMALGLSSVFRGLYSPRLVEFQKQLSFWRDFAIEIIGKLIAFGACVSAALLSHSYWAIAVGTIVYPAAMIAYSYYLVPYWPRLSLAESKVFYGFVGWASAAQIIGSLNWQFERLLLGKMQPIGELGLFTTSSDLSNIPFFAFFGPMIRPLMAAFTHLKDDQARLAASYQRAVSAALSVGLPLLVGMSLTAEPLVFIVLGPRWIGAAHFVRWLALALTPALFTFPVVPLLMTFGQTRTFFWRNVVEISVKVPIAVIGVLTLGFMGVIISRFLSGLLANIVCLLIVRRLLGLSVCQQIGAGWRAVFATVVMAIVVPVLLGALAPATTLANALVALVMAAVVGSAVYVGVLIVAWIASGRPDGLERMVWRTGAEMLARLHPTRHAN